MKDMIYCKPTAKGVQSFYLVSAGTEYFLFNQNYRRGVQEYYRNGVLLSQAMNCSKAHNNNALIRTMTKLPLYIRYLEKEYDIEILEKTKKRNSDSCRFSEIRCA